MHQTHASIGWNGNAENRSEPAAAACRRRSLGVVGLPCAAHLYTATSYINDHHILHRVPFCGALPDHSCSDGTADAAVQVSSRFYRVPEDNANVHSLSWLLPS